MAIHKAARLSYILNTYNKILLSAYTKKRIIDKK